MYFQLILDPWSLIPLFQETRKVALLSTRRDMPTINFTFICLKGIPSNVSVLKIIWRFSDNPQHEGKWAELTASQSQNWGCKEVFLF